MKKNISTRKVNITEANALLKLSRQTFFDAFAAVNNPDDIAAYATQAFTIEKVTSELENPHSHFYFALLDDEIIGYLKLNSGNAQTEFRDNNALEVERIYILKKYQGNKFGEQLLNFAIALAQQAHCKYIWLGVWDKNQSAIRFYQSHGFNIFGSHYFMLGSDKQTDILMKLDLV
ncbi:MAG: GNAT family N-acetyltransferase [Mucilaginibacter sp.]|uniref:GNAT family N-acetyltransferase n=1 Tax=Mucilaginibacter sp. TaxID=1882438 RepID=UPI00326500D4